LIFQGRYFYLIKIKIGGSNKLDEQLFATKEAIGTGFPHIFPKNGEKMFALRHVLTVISLGGGWAPIFEQTYFPK
jgi:hypothetical protein